MKKIAFFLSAAAFIAACAPEAHKSRRYFWPPPADQAKIEYITFYQTDRDILRGFENRLFEAIFGIERPTRLFRRPAGIGSDGKGKVFVADPGMGKVVILDLNTGKRSALVNENGSENAFAFPYALDFADDGRCFLTDSIDAKVSVHGVDGRKLGEFSAAELKRPTGIAVDSKRRKIYVVDTGNHHVVIFDFHGQVSEILGSRGAGNGKFNFPLDVDLDTDGNFYVLDSMNARVQKFDPDGNFLSQFGERGTALGSFQLPKALAVSPSGHVYVTDGQKNCIIIFDRDGRYLLTLGGRYILDGKVSPGGFNQPLGIDVDESEAIWVADSLNGLIHRLQYLNDAYLAKKPILPDEAVLPPEWTVLKDIDIQKEIDPSRSPAAPDGGTSP